MDVTTINNFTSRNIDYNNIQISAQDRNSIQAEISVRNDFDYDKVMMNLEDVKNFLFMLIGGNLAKVAENENRGSAVNTFA